MSLEAGHKLGPYVILEPAGAGGMGEVYKATDTRLDRTVAIKVLPSHLSTDKELRARFDREARTISNLTHPNICALYDVGHEGGVDYLVMEYLEGQTLTQRIHEGPVPTADIFKIGIEICSALDVAHRNGVVHRDLKPGNVMITKSGAKLVDFGLAKLADAGGDVVNSALTQMATQQRSEDPLTERGTILGTFQYMSPEQLEGKAVDARSDVFALGAILYEMATGKKAFEGQSQASLIAAILERTPPAISTLQPSNPPALDHIVRACLAKDPDERVQTAHDVRLQLQWIREGGSQIGVPAAVASSRRRRSWLGWGLAGLLGVSTIVLAFLLLGRDKASPVILSAEITFPNDLDAWLYFGGGSFALSPDGRQMVVYLRDLEGAAALWVRDMASGEIRRLNGTENGSFPFWSPDGRYIGFFASGRLKRIEATGGSAVTVCDVPDGRGGSWNRDGVILFGRSTTDGIYSVPDGGGDPTQITTPDSMLGITDHRFPWFLPDGEHFLFTARGQGGAFLCVGSLSGGAPKQVLPIRSNGMYVDGHVLYVRENTLVARPFDVGTYDFTDDARIVVEPVNRHDGYARGSFSVSETGMLLYARTAQSEGTNVAILDRKGATVSTIETGTNIADLVISHAGGTLAMMRSTESSGNDVWIYDLERRVFTRVTFDDSCDDPVFSPDGTTLAYSRNGDVMSSLASGVGKTTEFYRSSSDDLPVDWSRDGARILFLSVNSMTKDDVWVYDIASGEAEAILNTPYREIHAQFSPDANWIAYASNESGQLQVYVIDYPGLTKKVQVSRDGGQAPRWRADGRELYFLAASDSMMAISFDVKGGKVAVGEPAALFAINAQADRTHQYAVSPDGNLFYTMASGFDAQANRLDVLVGWPERVRLSSGQ